MAWCGGMMKTLNSGLKALLLGAFAGISILGFSATATAFETVMVDGVQATRIMIAPPRNTLERTIRDGLRDAMAQAPTGRAADDASRLYYFYGARHFEPLWLTETDGDIVFSGAAEQILAVFKDSYLQGLDPADYMIDLAALDGVTSDPAALASLEADFSAAILHYANDAHTGRLDPRSVSGYIDLDAKSVDEAELENAAEKSEVVDLVLALSTTKAMMGPDHPLVIICIFPKLFCVDVQCLNAVSIFRTKPKSYRSRIKTMMQRWANRIHRLGD